MWFDIFEKAPFLELSAEVHKTCIDRCISFTRTLYGEQDIKKDKNEAMINQDNPGLTTKLRLYKQNCFGSRNNGYTYKDVLVEKNVKYNKPNVNKSITAKGKSDEALCWTVLSRDKNPSQKSSP